MSGKPKLLKKINLNLIYQALIDLKSATRLELSACTKISLTTIGILLDELLLNQQIVEVQLDRSSGGRRAQRYALNARKNLMLSFYVRNNYFTYQLINLTREIVDGGTLAVAQDNWTEFAVQFVDACCKKWDIISIGIGASGMVKNGDIYTGCSLDNFAIHRISTQITEKYRKQIFVENDLNAVAFGYAVRQLAVQGDSGYERMNLAYIEFHGSSVCAGLVIDGKILSGESQFSGELSFMPLERGKTLNSLIGSVTSKEEAVDIICRVLAVVNCVTNPKEMVVGGKLLEMYDISTEQIVGFLKEKYLVDTVCPKIVFADSFEKDYMIGLAQLAQYRILSLLPLS